jgi:hypothetical protein
MTLRKGHCVQLAGFGDGSGQDLVTDRSPLQPVTDPIVKVILRHPAEQLLGPVDTGVGAAQVGRDGRPLI